MANYEEDNELDPSAIFEVVKKLGTSYEEPVNHPYEPPTARLTYDNSASRFKYVPDPPSQESSLIDPYEQRFIYPVSMQIANVIGGIQPVPDSMYRLIPQAQKSVSLFCVVSRSNIKKIDSSRIAWPAIMIVVKEIPIVKVICTLDFSRDQFHIWQIIFWRNDTGSYEKPITRGNQPIPPLMVAEFVARYLAVEGIR